MPRDAHGHLIPGRLSPARPVPNRIPRPEYVGKAGDTMRFCAADAGVNGLGYDRQEEELAVATFAGSIRAAATDYLLDPAGDPTIPDWARVEAVLPDFLPALLDAVRSENPQMR